MNLQTVPFFVLLGALPVFSGCKMSADGEDEAATQARMGEMRAQVGLIVSNGPEWTAELAHVMAKVRRVLTGKES